MSAVGRLLKCSACVRTAFGIAVYMERLDSGLSSHYHFLERQQVDSAGHRRRSRLDISSPTITRALNGVAVKSALRKNRWTTMRLPIPSPVTTHVQINGLGELHSIGRHDAPVFAGNTGQ